MKNASTFSRTGAVFRTSLVIALIGFGTYFDHVAPMDPAVTESAAEPHRTAQRLTLFPEVQRVAQWAIGSHDHGGLPFVVVDKPRSRLFAFDPQGRFLGTTSVLLGDAGTREPPPGSRFVADTWRTDGDGGIVLVGHGTGEGFMHVPGAFYRDYLSVLTTRPSIGYVLPEVLALQEVLRSDDLETWFEVNFAHWRTPARRPS